jgi:competence protein ComEC
VCNTQIEIKTPENFSDFDYVRYLKNKNIYFTSPSVEISSCSYKFSPKKLSDIFLWLKRNLRGLRNHLSKSLESYLPEPQASLLIGILFGSERAFCEQFEEQLRVSGTTHIIAASGYNVTILILAINKILGFIKKKQRLVLSLLLIWIYCILSGLGASIVRATMMGSITILALLTGNVRNTHLLIPSGVFLLTLLSPKIIFDIGFQLSVLATLGLIYVLPSIEGMFERMFNLQSVPQFLEDNLLGTISCTLSTLPISISIFGKLSLVSVFANVLVLPLTESTMLYGSIALLGSFLNKNLSEILFSVPYIQLKVFEWVVEYFGSIEWGYVDVKTGWLGVVIGLFLFIFCIYFYPLDKENYYVKRLKDL